MMFKSNKATPRLTIDVFIDYRDERSFYATAEEIAEDGIFLKTQMISIPLNTNIRLQLFIGRKVYNIAAVVIDDCSQGIYVGFHKLQSNAYQAYRDLQRSTYSSTPLPSAA